MKQKSWKNTLNSRTSPLSPCKGVPLSLLPAKFLDQMKYWQKDGVSGWACLFPSHPRDSKKLRKVRHGQWWESKEKQCFFLYFSPPHHPLPLCFTLAFSFLCSCSALVPVLAHTLPSRTEKTAGEAQLRPKFTLGAGNPVVFFVQVQDSSDLFIQIEVALNNYPSKKGYNVTASNISYLGLTWVLCTWLTRVLYRLTHPIMY